MHELSLAFVWHQHQPYYPDDVARENPMPWVRLHGVKDYYGMALHLLEVPEMRCTINLVPSLLVQLTGYTERGASDRFLDVSRVPADGLSEADSLFLLDHFFMCNAHEMIAPYPRYAELFHRREREAHYDGANCLPLSHDRHRHGALASVADPCLRASINRLTRNRYHIVDTGGGCAGQEPEGAALFHEHRDVANRWRRDEEIVQKRVNLVRLVRADP